MKTSGLKDASSTNRLNGQNNRSVDSLSDYELRVKIGILTGQELPIKGTLFCDIPDYCNDLNAMHNIEPMVPSIYDYFEALQDVMGTIIVQQVIFATARQRAEAFVRSMEISK